MASMADREARIAALEDELRRERSSKEKAISNGLQIVGSVKSILSSTPVGGLPGGDSEFGPGTHNKIIKLQGLLQQFEDCGMALMVDSPPALDEYDAVITQGPSAANTLARLGDIDYQTLDDVLGEDFEVNSNTAFTAASHALAPVPHGGNPNSDSMDSASHSESYSGSELNTGDESYDELAGLFETSRARQDAEPSVLKVGLNVESSVMGGQYFVGQSSKVKVAPRRRTADKPSSRPRDDQHAMIRMHTRFAGPDEVIFPDFFRYQLFFRPDKQHVTHFRTIHFGNLPSDITLRQLLVKVRGGSIMSAVLCDTRTITGSMSALVTFIGYSSAANYERYARVYPIHFNGKEAVVTRLNTPTYPSSITSKRIAVYHHTRSIVINRLPHNHSFNTIKADMGCVDSNPGADAGMVHIWREDLVDVRVDFSSIRAAFQAFNFLLKKSLYKSASTIRFVSDPCARPLSELALDLPTLAPSVSARAPAPQHTINDDELSLSDDEDLPRKEEETAGHRAASRDPSSKTAAGSARAITASAREPQGGLSSSKWASDSDDSDPNEKTTQHHSTAAATPQPIPTESPYHTSSTKPKPKPKSTLHHHRALTSRDRQSKAAAGIEKSTRAAPAAKDAGSKARTARPDVELYQAAKRHHRSGTA